MAKGRSLCPQGSAGGRWQLAEFKKVPGIGEVGAHVFSAIIEDPARFATAQKLIKYACLAITDRSSDGKPLGYQRLERRGHRELKTLSYRAWRTACKSTTGDNAVQRFYRASRERTHDVRHARLNCLRFAQTYLCGFAKEGALPRSAVPAQDPRRPLADVAAPHPLRVAALVGGMESPDHRDLPARHIDFEKQMSRIETFHNPRVKSALDPRAGAAATAPSAIARP